MLFNTILASTIAHALGASAAPAPGADPRYAQLRIFGEPGCSAQNLGEIGVYGEHLNKCRTFGDSIVRSVSFEYKLLDKCTRKPSHGVASAFARTNKVTVNVYSDATCHLNKRVVESNSCLTGDKSYGSYYVDCGTKTQS